MKDTDLVPCNEDLFLSKILKQYKLNPTKERIVELREVCKHWKYLEIYSPKNVGQFLRYIEQKDIIKRLAKIYYI